MTKKYISKAKAFQIVMDSLIKYCPNYQRGDKIDLQICKEISKLLIDTKFGKPSFIFQLVNKRKEFLNSFRNYELTQKLGNISSQLFLRLD